MAAYGEIRRGLNPLLNMFAVAPSYLQRLSTVSAPLVTSGDLWENVDINDNI